MATRKQPFSIERIFKASPTILYTFLTTPSNLVQWFADHVDLNGDVYTFGWLGEEQDAEILVDVEDELLRLRWLDDEDDKAYLEYRIKKSEITEETILTITDFAEKGDIKDAQQLWQSQLSDLAKCMGG
jgi:uncharacterized protein YndB with AHSA1/START domain